MKTEKTPGKKIPIEKSDKRRFLGLTLESGSHPYVMVTYARACCIDNYFFDVVETECVNADDFTRLKAGDPTVVKELFKLAVATGATSFLEVKRLLDLRKDS